MSDPTPDLMADLRESVDRARAEFAARWGRQRDGSGGDIDLSAWLDERQRIRDENSEGPIPASAFAAALTAGVGALADAYSSSPVLLAMLRAALAVETHTDEQVDYQRDIHEAVSSVLSRVLSETGGQTDG